MSLNLRRGDVVKLNSGGPDMTVTLVYKGLFSTIMTCSWYSDDDTYTRAQFPVESLTLIKRGKRCK